MVYSITTTPALGFIINTTKFSGDDLLNDSISGMVNPAYNWPAFNYSIMICLYVIMLLTIILNLFSIVCIVHAKQLTPINILIVNLCLTDILYATNLPNIAAQFINKFTYSLVLCRLTITLDMICVIVSILNTTKISIF